MALLFAHRGFHAFKHGPAADDWARAKRPALAGFLERAWGIDAGYLVWIVQPVKLAAFLIATVVDQLGIDGIVNAAGWAARGVGKTLRKTVDGSVQSYALWMGSGAALLAAFLYWS